MKTSRENEHFFIIGAQRCGTTFAYELLDNQPNICMARPVRPEPKYFLDCDSFHKDYKTYLSSCFPHLHKESILGEKGTSYLENPEVVKSIVNTFPNGKFVIVLRDPVERAISNYFFSVKNKIETRSLEDVFLKDVAPPMTDLSSFSVSPFDYLKRGHYLEYIEQITPMMNEDNLKITVFEELVSSENSRLDLVRFLGADPDVYTSFEKNVNAAERTSQVSSAIYQGLREYYKSHNLKLSEYLNRSLAIWS